MSPAFLLMVAGALRSPVSVAHHPRSLVRMAPLHDLDRPRMPRQNSNPMSALLEQNRAWAAALREKPGLLERLRQHRPKYLWIGCSDARVPANQIIGEGPGEVFVHRNIANLVVNTDVNLMAIIQYAIDVLKVPDIIVCGHYECGGVRAAMEPQNHNPPLENWLRNIRDVVRLHQEELRDIGDEDERYRRLVELNTIEQTLNVFKTGVVQRARNAAAKEGREIIPRVHALVYDPLNLVLTPLKVDFKKAIGEYEDVYRLYPTNRTPQDNGVGTAGLAMEEEVEYFV